MGDQLELGSRLLTHAMDYLVIDARDFELRARMEHAREGLSKVKHAGR